MAPVADAEELALDTSNVIGFRLGGFLLPVFDARASLNARASSERSSTDFGAVRVLVVIGVVVTVVRGVVVIP